MKAHRKKKIKSTDLITPGDSTVNGYDRCIKQYTQLATVNMSNPKKKKGYKVLAVEFLRLKMEFKKGGKVSHNVKAKDYMKLCTGLERRCELKAIGIEDYSDFGIGIYKDGVKIAEQGQGQLVLNCMTTNKGASIMAKRIGKKETKKVTHSSDGNMDTPPVSKKKKTRESASTPERPEDGTRNGTGVYGKRPKGKTSGLGVRETFALAFRTNGKAKKADRLTDVQITKFIKSEFPGRDSEVFKKVNGIRQIFNRLMTETDETFQSIRYDEEGEPITKESRGRPRKVIVPEPSKPAAKKTSKRAGTKGRKALRKAISA